MSEQMEIAGIESDWELKQNVVSLGGEPPLSEPLSGPLNHLTMSPVGNNAQLSLAWSNPDAGEN